MSEESPDSPTRPTAREVEATDWSLGFRFQGVASKEDAYAIVDALVPLLQELAGSDDDPGLDLAHVRHIAFTNDLREEVFYWQRQLGRPEGITDGEVQAVGKALSWLDERGAVHSVVLFNLNIAYGLLDERPLAQALVAHELAHAHYAPVLRDAFGEVVDRQLYASEWPGVRRQLAIWCFDEFLAEHVAEGFLDDECRELGREALGQIAAATHRDVRERVAAYRHDGDHAALWGSTITSVSALMNQMGRVAGQGPKVVQQYMAALNDEQEGLGDRLSEVSGAIELLLGLSIDGLGPSELASLESVVESVFHSVGVIPKWHEEESALGIDVPFWPGDRERAEREYYERTVGRHVADLARAVHTASSLLEAIAGLNRREDR